MEALELLGTSGWRLPTNRELKRPTKCLRVVCLNPKRMTTNKPRLRDKETFLMIDVT